MNRLNFEQEKQLIEYFRDNPSLWNTKDKDYNNRMLRTQKLETIANFLQLTRKDVYEKYRNLRTTFFREHKRVEQSVCKNGQLPPGEQAQLAYVSKWRHYQNMLFLTKVDKSLTGLKLEQNEDSTSNEQVSSMNHQNSSSAHLNNGHDTALVIDTAGSTNSRAQPMDTSGGDNDSVPVANSTSLIVQNITPSSTTVPNSGVNHSHLSNHSGEDLILINTTGEGTTVNGGTTAILAQNGIGIMNSRILSSNSVTNRSGVGSAANSATIVSISPSQNHHPPLSAAHSVIYANHQLTPGNGSLHRIKAESAADLQRHLSSATNNQPTIIPVLSALPMQTALQLTSQPAISLNLNQSHLASAGLASPQLALAAAATSSTSLVGTKSSVNSISSLSFNTTKSQSQTTPFQSTPIPAPRKSSLLLLTRSQDHSPVVSSPTALTLESSTNSSPLDTSGPYVSLTTGHQIMVSQSQSQPHLQLVTSVPSTSTNHTQATTNSLSNNNNSGSPIPINGKMMDYSEMREVIKTVVQEAIVEYEDEEMAFCRSLAASLRHLDRSKKDVAKLELQQVIVRHTNPTYGNNLLNSYHHGGSNMGSCGNLMEDETSARINNNGANNTNHLASNNTVSTIMSSSNNNNNSTTTSSSSKSTSPTGESTNNNSDAISTKGQMMSIDGDHRPSNGHSHLDKS